MSKKPSRKRRARPSGAQIPPETHSVTTTDRRLPQLESRARQRTWAARVVLWLPDVNDPGFWAQLADECRRLARLTREEEAIVAGFARLVSWTE